MARKRKISITMPKEIVDGIDELVGPRNRSRVLSLVARWQLATDDDEANDIQSSLSQIVREAGLVENFQPFSLTEGSRPWPFGEKYTVLIPVDV